MTPRKGPIRAMQRAQALKPFDAIIVPGYPYNGVCWDSVMKARVLWAWILYKSGFTRNIIFSGGAVYTPYKESVVMGLFAQQLGVPQEHIFYDTMARHSTENVFYSYLIAKKLGFKSLALATNSSQSFLLRSFMHKRFATPIYHLPFIIDSLSIYNSANPRINAVTAKSTTWTSSIKEQESFGKRIGGMLGRGIDWTPYKNRRLEAL